MTTINPEQFVRGCGTHKCVICKKKYNGYGNNADPLKKGYCCDKCNFEKVLPARLGLLKEVGVII